MDESPCAAPPPADETVQKNKKLPPGRGEP